MLVLKIHNKELTYFIVNLWHIFYDTNCWNHLVTRFCKNHLFHVDFSYITYILLSPWGVGLGWSSPLYLVQKAGVDMKFWVLMIYFNICVDFFMVIWFVYTSLSSKSAITTPRTYFSFVSNQNGINTITIATIGCGNVSP